MNKNFHLAKVSESRKLIEQLEEDESQEGPDDECDGFKFKQIDSEPEVSIRSTEKDDKYKRFEQDIEEQKNNTHQESNLLFRANPKKVLPSRKRSLELNSYANLSDNPSSYEPSLPSHILKPTQLPGFTTLYKKPATNTLRSKEEVPEPSAKKLKPCDDDFIVSQEDLDLIDSLE